MTSEDTQVKSQFYNYIMEENIIIISVLGLEMNSNNPGILFVNYSQPIQKIQNEI